MAEAAIKLKKNKKMNLPGRILAEDERIVTLAMPTDVWIALPGHPRQRDTERHARAAHWREARHAEGALKTHLAHVTAALLDGKLIKVDGHTRAYLWASGKLERPDEVIVTAYKVRDQQELLDLYRTFDVPSAGESWTDRVLGAFREHGYTPRSNIISRGLLANATHIALRGIPMARRSRQIREFDIYKAVGAFLPEIIVLDRMGIPQDLALSGILAAGLIALTLHPESKGFFERLFAKIGEKRGGRMDPVEAILSVVMEYKAMKYRKPPLAQVDLCGRCLRAVSYWMEGPEGSSYWLRNKIQYLEVEPFVEKVREAKNIGDDPTL